MRLLLDTHAFIWWVADDPRLTLMARAAVGEPGNEAYVSAATAWEITTKHRLGKLPDVAALAANVAARIAAAGFSELAVSVAHAQHAGALPGLHRDPFDRMLIAQALLEGMTLISNERLFDRYGVTRVW